LEFGIYIRPGISFENMKKLTQYGEDNNYFGVFLNDHVHGFKEKGKEPYLESWTILSALSTITHKIRLGHVVLFNSLRNPAFLAKSIASLDVISDGRFELLIGAGWNVPEYEGYDIMEQGRGMPTAKERVDRLKESIQILRSMLNNEITNFEGKYWKLQGAINIPQPKQKNIRISVGALRDRMIKISAKYADGINLGSGMTRSKTILEKLEPELKKNNKTIENYFISGFGSITIAKDQLEYEKLVNELAARTGKSVEEIKDDVLIGTPDILIKKLSQLKKMGLKLYIMSMQPAVTIDEIMNKFQLFDQTVRPFV
jgi:alkanesulfonate monooxygenase SsuD/methylene tetrahydromethanopterin reductase-like flavin-dependent oxidoreductase (luciferase family)